MIVIVILFGLDLFLEYMKWSKSGYVQQNETSMVQSSSNTTTTTTTTNTTPPPPPPTECNTIQENIPNDNKSNPQDSKDMTTTRGNHKKDQDRQEQMNPHGPSPGYENDNYNRDNDNNNNNDNDNNNNRSDENDDDKRDNNNNNNRSDVMIRRTSDELVSSMQKSEANQDYDIGVLKVSSPTNMDTTHANRRQINYQNRSDVLSAKHRTKQKKQQQQQRSIAGLSCLLPALDETTISSFHGESSFEPRKTNSQMMMMMMVLPQTPPPPITTDGWNSKTGTTTSTSTILNSTKTTSDKLPFTQEDYYLKDNHNGSLQLEDENNDRIKQRGDYHPKQINGTNSLWSLGIVEHHNHHYQDHQKSKFIHQNSAESPMNQRNGWTNNKDKNYPCESEMSSNQPIMDDPSSGSLLDSLSEDSDPSIWNESLNDKLTMDDNGSKDNNKNCRSDNHIVVTETKHSNTFSIQLEQHDFDKKGELDYGTSVEKELSHSAILFQQQRSSSGSMAASRSSASGSEQSLRSVESLRERRREIEEWYDQRKKINPRRSDASTTSHAAAKNLDSLENGLLQLKSEGCLRTSYGEPSFSQEIQNIPSSSLLDIPDGYFL